MNGKRLRNGVLFALCLAACGGSSTSPSSSSLTSTPPTTTPAPVNIAGSYDGSIVASSVCSGLPSDVRRKNFIMNVTQTGNQVAGTITGYQTNLTSGTISGNQLQLMVAFAQGDIDGIFVSCTFTGPARRTIVGDCDGIMGSMMSQCRATNHQLVMEAR